MEDCTFCHIVEGDESAHLLYEGEEVVAFLDANPAVRGHTLVVPRAHVDDVLLADESTARAVSETARAVALAMRETLRPDGFSVFHTTGGLVGNVEHAHLHLLPRFEGDGLGLSLSRERLADHDPERLVSRIGEGL
ncbi:HIT family protein [Halosimplex salinum]|uniref:HIT family protein n=1 Tax=Halosimplex salinum TaxID=1710538 RepID=UPI000F499576|nr:HIT family protein [Halosimplex salinum]